jgi:hypothetical protein
MNKIFICVIVSLFLIASGCQQKSNSVEPTVNVQSKKDIIQERPEKLSQENAKKILENNINSLYETLKKSGEEHGWNNANPVDYEKVKPDLLKLATEKFANSILKELATNFYCECDNVSLPQINYDVRFTFEEEKDKLNIVALEPATEISNMGFIWEFTLVKEEDKWKMDHWNRKSLEGQDLKLTKEEAEKLFTKNNETATFYQEYESKDATGKAYILKVKGSGGERLAAISSKDTRFVYDFEVESETNTETTSSKETLEKFNIFNEYLEKMHLGSTKEDLIRQFGQPSSEKETASDIILEYADAIYTISKGSNQVYQVEVIGKKATTYYKNFEEVSKVYNFDDVYAAFLESKSQDEKGYYLIYEGYNVKHIYSSDNENGNPIKSILVQELSYK